MSNLVTSDKSILKGLLFKKGQINKSWKERYFVLYSNRKLEYYEKEQDYISKKNPIKTVDLSELISVSSIPSEKEYYGNNNNDNNTTNNKDIESFA